MMATTTETAQKPPETTPPSEPRRGWLAPYKEDQGRHVRMTAFWTTAFFLVFGCKYLYDILVQFASLRTALGGIRIPVVGVDLSPAFLVSFLLFCAGMIAIQRWQQRPKIADLLIETEAELRKVTWPKGQEVLNTAVIVIVSVLLIGAFLAIADAFLARLMRYLLLGAA